MITEATAVTLRQNLGDMLNRVQYRRDSVVITKDGKPVAALVDVALFARIRAMQERFDALCDRLAKAYEGVPEDVGMSEIERATALARQATADEWRNAGRLAPAAKAASSRHRAADPQRKSSDVPSARSTSRR